MPKNVSLLIAAPLLVVAASGSPSAPRLRYTAPAEPMLYQSLNPWRMYWLRPTGDTVGDPVTAFAVERWDWSRHEQALRVIIDELSLDARRHLRVDTFDLEPTGRVTAINSSSLAPHGRWDLLPHVPDGTLAAVGATWTDSFGFGGALGPWGQRWEARRIYRIERVFDSAGVRLVEIVGRGDVHYRDSRWVDSAAGRARWLDVNGPFTERALVRLDDGVLQHRSWRMDLRGVGGDPAIPEDSVRAGLQCSSTLRPVTPERFALLSRPLRGADTMYTVHGQSLEFLHVTQASPHQITSGMTRADGWVATATSTFADGVPRLHEAVWSSPQDTVIRLAVAASGDSLRVSGSRTAVRRIPTAAWAVADRGMAEHLVPALLGIDRTWTFRDFAVYRPLQDHWDTGTARVRRLDDGFLAEVVLAGGTDDMYAIFSRDGELLYTEGGDHPSAFRVPRPDTAARDKLDRILQQLQHADTGDR